MDKKRPLLSVITVCYRNYNELVATLDSIPTEAEIELVVVDGGGDEKILNYLKSAGKVSKWLSEGDNGTYDAMNKGVSLAGGEWVLFLNSGDLFNAKTSDLVNALREAPDNISMLAFSVVYDSGVHFSPSRWLKSKMYLHNSLHHQGTCYRASLCKSEAFDLRYKIAADYKFNFKALLSGYDVQNANCCLALCEDGGVSRAQVWKSFAESSFVKFELLGFKAAPLIIIHFFKLFASLAVSKIRAYV